ncbi:quinone-dependent dihydroorotate dehydrogenase [Sphingomonas sp. NSE70-1]|uniref:Dihydroorotate dehydrogenase (quinone) n=1 Tax=Sphingomonas caseinilyticus TaxID=2908205 RepID=A0ABT0RVB4_9SPHN|nr:quinone-dependent dihydroorotate dehydrogenase [Sphingomonas caseinilyticus]MCL6698957.1 quinone-dependent dihydroorotate dehydrogenase [Sphingomonas caseinilyticus]
MALYKLLRPLAFALDAETAHRATIAALSVSLPLPLPRFPAELEQQVAGLSFPSPVGLAAGFDKDAEAPDAILGLGFGFVEVGTITPKPQAGNPKPRLFRLKEDHGVINRMGFNNGGQAAALERLSKRERRGIVGVNIGANKDSADRIADYVAGVKAMSPVADYLTVNISSPNTPGLRNLQAGGELVELLAAVRDARQPGLPVCLKVAPDLESGDHDRIVRAAIDSGIDALIVSNTTISRPPLKSRHAGEAGGLSGRPLKSLALDQIRRFRASSGGGIPLIAAGGIEDASDAWDRITAGASLVQLYSAMVYEGPGIARRIAEGLRARLGLAQMAHISEAVGSDAG